MIERPQIQLARDVGRLEQRLDFRSEVQPPVGFGIVQWLNADAIAREQQRTRAPVPNREPEHPAEPLDCRRAPLLVRVHNRFRIGCGVEAVAGLFELPAQLAIVVNLAVEDDPHGPILVVDRLVACGQVNDAQPAHPYAAALADERPLIVRTTMRDRSAHPGDERLPVLDGQAPRGVRRFYEAGDAAHGVQLRRTNASISSADSTRPRVMESARGLRARTNDPSTIARRVISPLLATRQSSIRASVSNCAVRHAPASWACAGSANMT